MRKSDQIRSYVMREYIDPARRRRVPTIRVQAGEVLRALKLPNGSAPQVCSALRAKKFLAEHDLILEKQEGPPGGQSTTVAFTYRLADRAHTTASRDDWFESLRGLGKETFAALGGGEKFIRKQREYFYEPEPADEA